MRVREHLTYANVAATLALAGVIGGGGAYAAGLIDSSDIKDNSVRSVDIKNRVGVKGKDVAERTLDAADFAPVSGRTAVTCDPPGTSYSPCVETAIRLKARGRLLIVATGEYFSEGGAGELVCRVAVDGSNDLNASFPGEMEVNTDALRTDGFARTLVTPRLRRGRHEVALRCQDDDDTGRLRGATIAVLGVLG